MAQVIYQDQYQKFNYALVKKLVFNTNEAHSLQSIVGYNGDWIKGTERWNDKF